MSLAFDSSEYKDICVELGYRADVHFVEVLDDGTITFTSGKPDEILGLYQRLAHHEYLKPAKSLQKTVENHFGAQCWNDDSFCREHGTYFVECGHLGHGDDYDSKETL